MYSSNALPAATLGPIPMPAGTTLNPVNAFQFDIINSSSSVVRTWMGPDVNAPSFDVRGLPSGEYTMRAARIDGAAAPIGTPATALFTLDQTIDVPQSVTVTLS